uniref:Uncharacterized protein n=1 Tax=Amphimedon queenslandica TaxID=400682 RepID=A0A1X7TI36_AMPQE
MDITRKFKVEISSNFLKGIMTSICIRKFIPDENVLLEAVTNELGVDSIDPSLLNMSDLLSLLQPDSDPLDQLVLTTEEASSDMIVLQQSDGMNVVQNLDLNINEEELLEGLPQELRDSVQAMLEDQ